MMVTQRIVGNSLADKLKENGWIVTFLISQTVAAIIWGARMDARVDALEAGQHIQDVAVSRLEERGSRSIPTLEARIKQHDEMLANEQKELNDILSTRGNVPPVIQVQLDYLKDQQMRILQALDSTYNLLNEHMRVNGEPKNIPMKK